MGACHLPPESLSPWPFPGSVKQNNSSAFSSQSKPIPTLALSKKVKQDEVILDCAYPRNLLSSKLISHKEAHQKLSLLHDLKSEDYLLHQNSTNLATAMLTYAEYGYAQEAQSLWDELLNSSFKPSSDLVSSLVIAYAKTGHFDEISTILSQIRKREFSWLPQVYSLAISCFGMGGQLNKMENILSEMVLMGFPVDSVTGNAYLVYYTMYGSLLEMEAAYDRLKRSRILIEETAIRAMSYAYIKEKKYYSLGEFLRDVGLGRRNVGNLLWNLLLLSYAAKFKMKTLQREFLGMVEAGFRPDLTTFNIRALAFSRMNLFWDLHISLEHMRHENVVPDLVTYGCVVDAYMDKRMGRNLDFALNKMSNLDEYPSVATEPFVFEAMGKGDFHLSSEAFLEFNKHKRWTYRKLIGIYVKKRHRSNQIFWNY